MLPDPNSIRAYVVTRRDLPTIQRGVQAAHALVELTHSVPPSDKHFRSWVEDHKTLLILSVKDEAELEAFHSWAHAFAIRGGFGRPKEFREPDIGDQITAVALYPMKYKDVPEAIRALPLA